MSGSRVDVWDPTSEGPWIVEQLRHEGLDVVGVGLADVVLTRADLVVMAGDAEGALGALKLLRDEGAHGDVPVILVGVPDGMEHHGEGPGFGADAVFARPVTFEPLISCVRRLLREVGSGPQVSEVGVARVEHTMRLSGEADGASSQVYELRSREGGPWRPREPTVQLGEGEDASAVVTHSRASDLPRELVRRAEERADVSWREPRERREGTGSRTPTGSRPGTGPSLGAEVPEPVIPPEQRAALSPWLHELLRAADRRVFPDRPPLALHLPAADEPPASLVPPELLEARAFHIDEPVVDDPIDAFTYVGGPAVPPAIHGSGADEEPSSSSSEVPRESRKTSPEIPARRGAPEREPTPTGAQSTTGAVHRAAPSPAAPLEIETVEWPVDDTVLGRSSPDGTRRGALGRGGALRLLWRVAQLGLDGTLELERDGAPAVRMTFLAGELRALDGSVASLALEALRRRGRATEAPADEAGAEAVLNRRVADGSLARFERDRLLREAREELLRELVRAPRASFTLRRLDDTEPGRTLSRTRVLARPLRASLVEAARTALGAAEVRELLGPAPVALGLGPRREAGLAAAELPFELVELLVRMEGRSLDDLLAAAPTEPGLAGALFALVAGDALVPTAPPEDAAPPPEARDAVRGLVDAAAELADDGDYFAILGVARDARDGALERAYEARRSELSALPLSLLGLSALEERRASALDALEEAFRALSDPRRRAAYAAALAR